MNTVILLLTVFGCINQGISAYRVVCIYTNWSQYRPDIGKFVPEDVDPLLCTHLIYVYAKLKGNRLIAAEWNDEGTTWSEGMFDRVQNLKQINPDLKTLLGVGGWMMGSKDFSRMASTPRSRRMFVTSAVKFLREKYFDGLTIDWQHPTKRGGRPYDKRNFSLLLKELRKAFEDESKKSQQPTLLLTAGVSASKDIIDSAYELDNLTSYTDFVNVMAYDLHGPWDNYTGHPSQLYPRKEEFGPSTEINVDASMKYWISNVPDRSKLVLGVSTYGRTFTLRKRRHTEYNVPSIGPGVEGDYTKQPGMLAYYERCSQYADATRVWDDYSKVSYWFRDDQWIAGEDIDSIKAKILWLKTHRAGGVSIWSLDTDDFSKVCSDKTYPLLRMINSELEAPFKSLPTTETITQIPQTTTQFSSSSGYTQNVTTATPSEDEPSTSLPILPSTIQLTTIRPKQNQEPDRDEQLKNNPAVKLIGKVKPKADGKINDLKKDNLQNVLRNNQDGTRASGIKKQNKQNKTNKLQNNTRTKTSQPVKKQGKQFMSRNENPNKNSSKAKGKKWKNGRRIVVKRKRIFRKGKHGRKQWRKKKQIKVQKSLKNENKQTQTNDALQKSQRNKPKSAINSKKLTNVKEKTLKKDSLNNNTLKNVTANNINDKNNAMNEKEVSVASSKEALKSMSTKKHQVPVATTKGIADNTSSLNRNEATKKPTDIPKTRSNSTTKDIKNHNTSTNDKTSENKQKAVAVSNQTNTKKAKSGKNSKIPWAKKHNAPKQRRKIPVRRKLTKKQLEILRRRRNRQNKLKKQQKKNKKPTKKGKMKTEKVQ